jgi:hypothetical protein
MYAPICELRRSSTMLPLRSRTSWRLRAFTVTCLPRLDLGRCLPFCQQSKTRIRPARRTPRRARGTSLGYQAHPPVPGPSGPPGRGRVTRTLWPFRSGRTPGRGRHCHVAGPAQRDPCGGGTGITQISYGSNGAVSNTCASASPTTISSNSASLTRPGQYPGHRERPRPGRPGVPSGPPGA